VTIPIGGPGGKEAPVKTYWIYERGEESPRLTSLYIDVREWRRWERGRRDDTGA
jgi:hypothetical protein